MLPILAQAQACKGKSASRKKQVDLKVAEKPVRLTYYNNSLQKMEIVNILCECFSRFQISLTINKTQTVILVVIFLTVFFFSCMPLSPDDAIMNSKYFYLNGDQYPSNNSQLLS